jgi:hypothetical protein
MSSDQKDFDLDLRFGKEGEQWLSLLAGEQKIEVKRERDLWAETGHIAFEYLYKGEPSGVSSTKADWWAHILTLNGKPVSVLLFPVDKLRKRLRTMLDSGRAKTVSGGDGNHSSLILVNLKDVSLLLV